MLRLLKEGGSIDEENHHLHCFIFRVDNYPNDNNNNIKGLLDLVTMASFVILSAWL